MRNKLDKNRKFTIGIFVIIIGIIFVQIIMENKVFSNEDSLKSGWNIYYHGNEYLNKEISSFKFNDIVRGDKVILTYTLDEKKYKESMSLQLMARYSTVTVFLNDKQIYEFGTEHYKENKNVGTGFCWVELPEYTKGDKLRIEYTIAEDGAIKGLDMMTLLKTRDIYSELIIKNFVTFLVVCFLFLGGFMWIWQSIWEDSRKHMRLQLICIGVLCMDVSVWVACYTKIIELFTQNIYLKAIIEYTTMYIAFDVMILAAVSIINSRKKKKIYEIVAVLYMIFQLILIILNQKNIMHFIRTLIYVQVVSLAILAILLYEILRQKTKENSVANSKLIKEGMVVAVGFIGMEIVRYQINNRLGHGKYLQASLIPVALLVGILFLLEGYNQGRTMMIKEKVENHYLQNIAYTDALTNISNRARCTQVLNEYQSQKKPISILIMDLNKFKSVNDTFGHVVGDLLLQVFATQLKECYAQQGCVGRMGGDEFVVIMDYMNAEEIEKQLHKFNDTIEELNKSEKYEFEISFSAGYASEESGQEADIWKVYRAADKEMYRQKNGYAEA